MNSNLNWHFVFYQTTVAKIALLGVAIPLGLISTDWCLVDIGHLILFNSVSVNSPFITPWCIHDKGRVHNVKIGYLIYSPQ